MRNPANAIRPACRGTNRIDVVIFVDHLEYFMSNGGGVKIWDNFQLIVRSIYVPSSMLEERIHFVRMGLAPSAKEFEGGIEKLLKRGETG